jgi:DNA-binding XRE family transcriptional regulator
MSTGDTAQFESVQTNRKPLRVCEGNCRCYKAVAAVVSASRRDADLGQQAVADSIGMSRNTLVRIESGQLPMTIPELMAFAKALKLSPTVLMDLIVRWHR